ncbi:MAG TPA: PEGA domain-containing protein [Polyangiaceae bacterium]|nr:PEGA domain-containing protein [Polyangiaceae bacterium]
MRDDSVGRLYVAEQREIRGISRTVALLCIRPELAQSPEFRARFSELARDATHWEHPNIVTVFEMSHIDGRYFISMEYLPAETLGSLLERCNTHDDLPPDTAAHVVKQAAAALQYLHDQRRASPHRVSAQRAVVDTSNLFISYHGTVKYLAMDARSLLGEGTDHAVAQGPVSSAPGSTTLPIDANGATGVPSLGALLRTCLVGDAPLLEPDVAGTDARASDAAPTATASRPPAALRTLRPDVPEALDAIVRQALSSSSRERFANPRAMADALDRYLRRRDSRPTPKQLRRSMEQWFGAERAALEMQIARGRDVEAALSRRSSLLQSGSGAPHRPPPAPRPRALWSTSQVVFSQLSRASIAPRSFERFVGTLPDDNSQVTSILSRHLPSSFASAPPSLASAELPAALPPAQPPPSRSWLISTVMAACAVLAVGLILILSVSSSQRALSPSAPVSASSERSGRLDVRSTPEGAAVFLDGEPTGLRTPVSLKGLARDRTLHVRVEKSGFGSEERTLSLAGEAAVTASFELRASDARVRFEGMPANARVYVDDSSMSAARDERYHLPVGSHAVRIETPNALLFSERVDVVPGDQTIRVVANPGAMP